MKTNTQTEQNLFLTVIRQLAVALHSSFSQFKRCQNRLLSIILLTNLPVFTVHSAERYLGDWFETEIILFSQLDNKAALKEHFDTAKTLPQPSVYLDLLTDYLNPDITSLKTQLPMCETKNNTSSKPEFSAISSSVMQPLTDIPFQLIRSKTTPVNNGFLAWSKEGAKATMPADNQAKTVLMAETDINFEPFISAAEHGKIFSPSLCAINEETFKAFDINHDHFSYNGFAVNTVPVIINAIENTDSQTPYLLSEPSLQLSKIKDQLRRSKNFKPLLHLGWRQQVFDLKSAIPVKLFAGDNLKHDHFQELNNYQRQQQHTHTSISSEIPTKNNGTDPYPKSLSELDKEQNQRLLQAKKLHIENIAMQIDKINFVEQAMKPFTEDSTSPLNTATVEELAAPSMVQPWMIDGFIKLHLLNNYLNITTDFNIINQSPVKLDSEAFTNSDKVVLNEVNVATIPMRQHRRVISSEIHYFDHPHIGLIIQIRKYQPPSLLINTDVLSDN